MEFLAQFHPKVIHYAVAFLTLYVLLEVIAVITKRDFFNKTAHLILFLGVLGAAAAVLTGREAFEKFDYWNSASSQIMEEHEEFANITLWYFFALLAVRTFLVIKKKFVYKIQLAFAILALVGGFLIYTTAERGGQLVFKHGVGTEYLQKQKEAE